MIQRSDPKAHVRHVEEGVLTTRPGTGGYRNATIAPALAAHGDFDIIASYRDFRSTAVKGGNGPALLLMILDNPTADELIVSRKHIHHASGFLTMTIVLEDKTASGDRLVAVNLAARSSAVALVDLAIS